MKITAAKVVVCSPGRNFVTLKVFTDQRVYGLVNNFGIQEYMPHPAVTNEVFKTNYRYEQGYLVIDDTPGIGVDLDEAAAAKFPYRPASLPVARKSDGTAFHW